MSEDPRRPIDSLNEKELITSFKYFLTIADMNLGDFLGADHIFPRLVPSAVTGSSSVRTPLSQPSSSCGQSWTKQAEVVDKEYRLVILD